MNRLTVGELVVTVQRTVRVPEGRAPAALPPGLGAMELHQVSDYRDKCPQAWEDNAVFVVLWPQEAMWLNFGRAQSPVAVVCGAGGINALTGKPLGLALEKDGYMVCPPQPWLDGWKDVDGTVYQFVATKYEGGQGLTVGEQILGEKSKSGGIGLAVFQPKDRSLLKPAKNVVGGWMPSIDSSPYATLGGGEMKSMAMCATRGASFAEMGVGKGGKIHQKIYPDPHGLDVWKPEPADVRAIYLVGAEAFAKITGQPAPPSPVTADKYPGPWYGLQDKDHADVAGSGAFTGLKSVFASDALPATKD